ncbi:MAG: DUF4381 domain-containing protein [Gammaproteobacteria bacterium]|nr:DUF4381 domain-containing protein [Gammaproteobacteria bacterium]
MNNINNLNPTVIDPELAKTLEQLKYIHFPSDSLWWPPAPGPMLLIILSIISIVLVSKKIIIKTKLYYRNRPLQIALRELHTIEQKLDQKIFNPTLAAQELNMLLKKAVKKKFVDLNISTSHISNPHILSLSGEDWLQFLNKSGKTELFTSDGRILISLAYQKYQKDSDLTKDKEHKIKKLIDLTKHWIKLNLS